MLGFLFSKKEAPKDALINELYPKIKKMYCSKELADKKRLELSEKIEKFGYLPYSHQEALEKFSPEEIFFALEKKFEIENVLENETFKFQNYSPVSRLGIKNADWIKKEGHDIKLISLCALGNGSKSSDPAKFIDWLYQLAILPGGVKERGILPTTIYLTPFHPREFGCAYLPKSSEVSENLEDPLLKENLELDSKAQVKLFIQIAQLAGHPVIYDILPQIGRFSKLILSNPHLARWYDIKTLMTKIEDSIEIVAKKLEEKFDKDDIEVIKDICKQTLKSGSGDLSEHYQNIFDEFENELASLKKQFSEEMTTKSAQLQIQKLVFETVLDSHGLKNKKKLCEEDITKHAQTVEKLIEKGYWPAPGGAWCSCGVPIFDRMSDCGAFPIFKHIDCKGKDVSELANLDCQTPFYFTYLENGSQNEQVTDFFIAYCKKIQADFGFDGYRIDHLDHIVDEYSICENKPISYRVPPKVLGKLNHSLKEKMPYFALLAEYMLGGENFKEYHEDMKFDLLWGDDITAQYTKTPEQIIEDNQTLAHYNTQNFKINNLSILKTYNNQDGEFSFINQYPGQLGESGAIFKWFKYKTLPGGKYAQRPAFYVDGDESFTQNGIESVIGAEISMKRGKNYEFFKKFDAINRFAKSQEIITEGEAQIIIQDEDGFACWLVTKEPLKNAFLIAANYFSPKEKIRNEETDMWEEKEGTEVFDKVVNIPGDFTIKSEFCFDGENFFEKAYDSSVNSLEFSTIKPSEFKIYLLKK